MVQPDRPRAADSGSAPTPPAQRVTVLMTITVLGNGRHLQWLSLVGIQA
jgi:hypothetical protein